VVAFPWHTFTILQDVGGESTLVAHVGGVLAVLLLDDPPQGLVELRPHAEGVPEGLGTHGENHELLHGQFVTGMGASVDHIECLKAKTSFSI